MVSARECWNCHTYANMSLPRFWGQTPYDRGTDLMDCTFPRQEDRQENDGTYFVIYKCDRCGYPNIAHYAEPTSDDPYEPFEPFEWIPASATGKQYSDVPADVAQAASECYKCFNIGAYRAVVIMARSVLEAIITEKISHPANQQGKDKTLTVKLKDAADAGIIDRRLSDLAKAIKDIGNGATHNIFEEVSKDEAAYILGFMDLLIEDLYQQEERLKKLANLNQKFEQAKASKLFAARGD
ncbi:DUF4145 domain-containing protein [Bifidobacterium samirii]|uniref:DUF4145 domain-containing protein n=1 Tax=Bifidobacterium samirii TaxID=2306974 RepID=A0A430FVE5_9BIFI|nr:DUF4145 domain-containing protein [Bifidobacterium samirii]RSX57739.1 hypothetical protein D2E24_0587 [Bifidobacterium samirii]